MSPASRLRNQIFHLYQFLRQRLGATAPAGDIHVPSIDLPPSEWFWTTQKGADQIILSKCRGQQIERMRTL